MRIIASVYRVDRTTACGRTRNVWQYSVREGIAPLSRVVVRIAALVVGRGVQLVGVGLVVDSV